MNQLKRLEKKAKRIANSRKLAQLLLKPHCPTRSSLDVTRLKSELKRRANKEKDAQIPIDFFDSTILEIEFRNYGQQRSKSRAVLRGEEPPNSSSQVVLQNKYQGKAGQSQNLEEIKEKSHSERWATQFKRNKSEDRDEEKKGEKRSKSARAFKSPQNYKKLRNKKKATFIQDQINVQNLFSEDEGVNICFQLAGEGRFRDNETEAETYESMVVSSQGQLVPQEQEQRREYERAPLLLLDRLNH